MLKQYAKLWYLGLRESLLVHRCVVFLVLDSSRALRREILHCLLLNGGILLGSILLWERALLPVAAWLLRYLVAPCLGASTQRVAGALAQVAFQALWLLPVYMVTMLLSCGMWVRGS
ncbi:hypothetical protein Agub_g303 [Astrephomene gubernaculifera]|uniref:Uncharacterized protein n=1 Tax=Astrephomene gubernaculifera TaxID=47775 RepID=A0AAD3DGY6_9CHLO|nr:hypothetical protein Agub_g303 [Astrephomene gubernaculifera]